LLPNFESRLLILDGDGCRDINMMQVKTRCMGPSSDDHMALIAEVRERFP